jgi:hypothetical protein
MTRDGRAGGARTGEFVHATPAAAPTRAPGRRRPPAVGRAESIMRVQGLVGNRITSRALAAGSAFPPPSGTFAVTRTVRSAPPASVEQTLEAPGQPLEPAFRRRAESRFDTSFESVRVHSDAEASRSAQRLGADAYTVGSDVVFAAGRYSPGTPQGQRLLAHEVAHVVQQRRGGGPLPGTVQATVEADARGAAEAFATRRGPVPVAAGSAVGIARQTSSESEAEVEESRALDVARIIEIVSGNWVPADAEAEIVAIFESHSTDPALFDRFLQQLSNRAIQRGFIAQHYSVLDAALSELDGDNLARVQQLMATRSRGFNTYTPVEHASFSGELAQSFASGEAGNLTVAYGRGLVDAVFGIFSGIWSLLTHPVEVAKFLIELQNPTTQALIILYHREIAEYVALRLEVVWNEFLSAKPEEQARMIGRIIGEVELIIAAFAAPGAVAGAGRLLQAVRTTALTRNARLLALGVSMGLRDVPSLGAVSTSTSWMAPVAELAAPVTRATAPAFELAEVTTSVAPKVTAAASVAPEVAASALVAPEVAAAAAPATASVAPALSTAVSVAPAAAAASLPATTSAVGVAASTMSTASLASSAATPAPAQPLQQANPQVVTPNAAPSVQAGSSDLRFRGEANESGVGVLYIRGWSALSAAEQAQVRFWLEVADQQYGFGDAGARQSVSAADRQAANQVARLGRNALLSTGTSASGHTPDVGGGGNAMSPQIDLPRSVNSSIGGQWARYQPGFLFTGISAYDESTGQWIYLSPALENEPPPAQPGPPRPGLK